MVDFQLIFLESQPNNTQISVQPMAASGKKTHRAPLLPSDSHREGLDVARLETEGTPKRSPKKSHREEASLPASKDLPKLTGYKRNPESGGKTRSRILIVLILLSSAF